MANFDAAQAKQASLSNAISLLPFLQSVYSSGKQAQSLLAAYQANTDPVFVAAVNALHTASERAELAAMLTQIASLVTDWETNHRSAIGLAP